MGRRRSKRPWTEEELAILREMYPDHFAGEIAEVLGRGESSVYNKARQLGLKCNPEKIRRTGALASQTPGSIAARFQKGHVPDNKGKKMAKEIYERCAPTMFQKGHCPVNHKPVGSERVSAYGYVEVKVAEPTKWRLKHRVIWEEAYGPIPRGYNIQFKDKNPLNVTLDNLYLISKADQMRYENSFYAKYPKELQDVIRLKGVVNRVIHRTERDERK